MAMMDKEYTHCIHLRMHTVRRVSRGVPFDRRPDLKLSLCQFPLEHRSALQCPPAVLSRPCPHSGPYCTN